MPLIVGARFGTAVTSMLNAGSAADAWPSDTLITMLLVVPTWVEPGVPLRRPLAVSKLAHAGLFDTLKLKLSPSASLADGVNAYDCPAVTCVAGDPEITGVACWRRGHFDSEGRKRGKARAIGDADDDVAVGTHLRRCRRARTAGRSMHRSLPRPDGSGRQRTAGRLPDPRRWAGIHTHARRSLRRAVSR